MQTGITLRVGLVLLALAACGTPGSESAAAPAATETPAAPSKDATAQPRPWAHEDSDIPVDGRIHFGTLPNGLRFAWAENKEPEKRSYLRLHVDVGSLAEEGDELGLAHFLEHMAFNGSENFPAGTLIEWFQRHGMSFGADTNAHTSFSETVYKLDLPESDPETLREGLQVLRDFAGGLALDAKEIDAEKGVIDGEERERDSPGMRVFERQLDLLFGGTRLAERLPIGRSEVRARFDAAGVRDFYERWYRPDAMTLVLVGDLQGLDPEPLFSEAFGDMRVPARPADSEPALGRPDHLDVSYLITETEIPSVTISVQRLVPWEFEPPTVAEWLEDLPLDYAREMVNLRLRELAKREDAPFMRAGLSSAEALEVIDGEELSVTCDPQRWREALAFCEVELRRALENGFQGPELEELRANALRELDEGVKREPSAHSTALLNEILAAAEDPYVPTDAATNRALLRPAIEALTVEACHEALRTAWSRGALSVSAVGNLDLGDKAGAQLLAAYAASAITPVEAGETIAALEFAYASDAERAGSIVARSEVDDLGFTMVTFENGVRLNVKRTDFKENQILVGAQFGEGRLTLKPEQTATEWVGNQVLNGAGLAAHSQDDLRRLTAGREVGVGFSTSLDAFNLRGATTPEDLLFELELMCATLSAPGWRPDSLVQLRRQVPLYFQSLERQHQGPLLREFLPAIFDHDPRFGLPSEQAIGEVDMALLESWLAPHLADAPIEVTLVGDLDLEQSIAFVARTFGALPARREWRAYEEARVAPTPASGVRQTHSVQTEDKKTLVIVQFPVPDGLDADRRRRFALLDAVLSDRLRKRVREELGAAYAPGTSLQMSAVYPDVGTWMLQAMADPEQSEALVEAFLSTAEGLASEGVSAEELERQRAPIQNQRRDAKRTNVYWMEVMARAQRIPKHLDEVRSADAVFADTTAEELTPLAREFLKRERASILIVNPGT